MVKVILICGTGRDPLARLTGLEIQFGSGVSSRDEAKSIRRQQYKNANPIPSERVAWVAGQSICWRLAGA